jgi:hypothetical protein
MKWRACLVAAVAGVVVVMAASPALAKGADRATITGPGLAAPIVVGGDGEPGSQGGLGQLSDGSGLFVAMFGPDSAGGQTLEQTAPAGSLGPRYELTYRVPGGNPKPDTITQDLYPLAAGGPVTFTPAGQHVFGNTTSGGWYRAPASFSALLTTLGLPRVPDAVPVPSPSATTAAVAANVAERTTTADRTPWFAIGAALIGACVVAAAVFAVARRSKARVPSHR